MELYGNLSNEVKEQLKGWFYGMRIKQATDIDVCPLILPLSFAFTSVRQNTFDKNDFYGQAKMAAKITEYGDFKEVGYHFWSMGSWSRQDNTNAFFVVALPKHSAPLSSEFAASSLTAPDNATGYFVNTSASNTYVPFAICMYDGVGTGAVVSDLVRDRLEEKVDMLIDTFGVDYLPFRLDNISPYDDPRNAYFRALMETFEDREFVVVRLAESGVTPSTRPTLIGSFYIQ